MIYKKEIVAIKMTSKEKEKLKKIAIKNEMSISEYIRTKLFYNELNLI